MARRERIVVGGFLGLLQAGGVTWDYVQYPLGFHELGYDVWYLEDTRLWPIYQEDSAEEVACRSNLVHLEGLMDAFGMKERWIYRDEVTGETFGPAASKLDEICETADVFVNVSCANYMRDEYMKIPVRALIDSDPMFTQIQYDAGEKYGNIPGKPGLREMLDAHTHFFTFGENVGQPDCRMATCGIPWQPTRQPVVMGWWPLTPIPPLGDAAFTTVMNWTAGTPLEYDGEPWGQKDIEFMRFIGAPARVPGIPVAVAAGQTTGAPFPREESEKNGWRVLDPQKVVPEWRSYRRFIEESFGEFSIAKETYVKANTGWFSCRSACYLAAGRPVVTQDTAWSRYVPSGEGLVAFTDMDEAVEGLRRVAAEPERHAAAARRLAEEYFDSRTVLEAFLDHTRTTPPRTARR